MASKPETAADRLRRMRKVPGFAPVWTLHAEQRLGEYGLDRLSCERVIRSGAIRQGEPDVRGREQVDVAGTVDGEPIEIVVEPAVAADGTEVVRIVTLKPKTRRR